MICPDIWTLPPPNTLITHKQDRLTDKAEHQLRQTIQSHYFNSLISVVVPDTTTIPAEIGAVLDDSTDHYVVEALALGELVKRTFIEAFVKRGHFYGLSSDTRIDIDDCAAVTPSNGADAPTLHLSLNKDVFQSLGLEGTVSYFTQKSRERYNIRLNLLDPNLSPDTKYYARVRTGLANDVLARMSMRIAWQPSADHPSACPSSVAKYFADAGYRVRLCQTSRVQHPEYSLSMPLLGRDEANGDAGKDGQFFATAADVVEFVGMLALGCEREPDAYLNGYRCAGRSMDVGNAATGRWQGLFTCDTIVRLLAELRKYIAARPHLPWVSLYCSGFAHSPVSFGHKEHTTGHSGNGDNAYVIVLGGDGEYLLTKVLGSNKMMK